MALEDDVRHCCEEVDQMRERAKQAKKQAPPELRRHFSSLEGCIERFSGEARQAAEKLRSGTREGLDRMVETWREAQGRVSGHLRVIEAKSFLVSAKRLATEGDFVAAGNELAAAVRDAKEAARFIPSKDEHLVELTREIERAAADVEAKATSTTAHIEDALKRNERLLEELDQAT